MKQDLGLAIFQLCIKPDGIEVLNVNAHESIQFQQIMSDENLPKETKVGIVKAIKDCTDGIHEELTKKYLND